MLTDLDLRLRLLVAAAIATLIVAVVLIVRIDGSDSASAVERAFDGGVLGLGRSTVLITPGTMVSGELGAASGVADDSITWKLDGDDLHLHGSGRAFSFTAPQSGELKLKVTARSGAESESDSTTFRVVGATDLAVSEVSVRGEVQINGGRPVQGEGLRTGTKIDARMGEISFRSLASIDGNLGGRTTYSGTMFQVSAQRRGTRVMNTVSIERDHMHVRSMHVEVEHLNNARYVTVQTPDAVAMVKGTGFDVSVSATSSSVDVDHGVVFTVDRMRMFAQPRELRAGDSYEIEAVSSQSDDLGAMLSPVGGALDAIAEHNPGVRTGAGQLTDLIADSGGASTGSTQQMSSTAIVNSVLTAEVDKVPPPVVVTGARDAGTQASDSSSGSGESSTSQGSQGDQSQGQGNNQGSPDTGQNGSGSDQVHEQSSTDDTNRPLPPPTDRAYMLGEYPGWPRCRPATHLLWNGSYRDDPARLRCVLREDFTRMVQSGRGYLPPKRWGCYRFHGRWNSQHPWCYPMRPNAIAELGNYVLPRGWNDEEGRVVPMPICSDGHTMIGDAYCHQDAS